MLKTVVLALFTATASAALVITAHLAAAQPAPYPQQQCFKQLPHLAKRLNVRHTTESSILVAAGCDGRQYDILALINALLDRMDKMK